MHEIGAFGVGHTDVRSNKNIRAVLCYIFHDAVSVGWLHQSLLDQRRTGCAHCVLPCVESVIDLEQSVAIELLQVCQFHVFSSCGRMNIQLCCGIRGKVNEQIRQNLQCHYARFFSNMQLLSKRSTQADIEQMCRKIVGISMPDSNIPLEFFNPSPLTAHMCTNWL